MNSLPMHRAPNPDVDTRQRPGFAIVDPKTDLFLCDDLKSPLGMVMGRGYSFGFCRASGEFRVWTSLVVALDVAGRTGCRVATVPRVIGMMSVGPAITWDLVPA